MADARIFCCIEGCRRSWKDDGTHSEIICGRHWKMASPLLRNRSKRLRATARALERKPYHRRSSEDQRRLSRLYHLHNLVWARIKRAASGTTEKPSGIDAILDEIGVR